MAKHTDEDLRNRMSELRLLVPDMDRARAQRMLLFTVDQLEKVTLELMRLKAKAS